MEPSWTTAEEEFLLSLIHSSSCGGLCRVVRNWAEIADLMTAEAVRQGFNTRAYNSSNVAYHYAQMPNAQLEQAVKDAATKTEDGDGAKKKKAKTPISCREGPTSRKLPSPQSSLAVLELATRATGPPKDFEKCKGQKSKRWDKKG
jgi:hypothetical protein